MKAPITYRKYVSINDIQKEYLPISKKKLRILVKRHLPYKVIGSRIFVERSVLEALLKNTDTESLSLS